MTPIRPNLYEKPVNKSITINMTTRVFRGKKTQYNWKSKGRNEEENTYLTFQEETWVDDALP